MEQFIIATPIGRYLIELKDNVIQSVMATKRTESKTLSPHAKRINQSIQNYFSNPKQSLSDLPLNQAKSEFQNRLRQALCAIPVGETRTYGELAEQLNSSPRAIGQACRHNPIPIIVPCHRVVAKTDLGGYSGSKQANLQKKQWLLRHENHEHH